MFVSSDLQIGHGLSGIAGFFKLAGFYIAPKSKVLVCGEKEEYCFVDQGPFRWRDLRIGLWLWMPETPT